MRGLPHGWDRAHRVSWRYAHGEIPEGLCILHHCDNRACVNPDHLYAGTLADNVRDMVERHRARGPRGARNRHSKLTESQVAEIRAAAPGGSFGWGQRKLLAEKYGVTGMTIYHIASGRTWRGVDLAVR